VLLGSVAAQHAVPVNGRMMRMLKDDQIEAAKVSLAALSRDMCEPAIQILQRIYDTIPLAVSEQTPAENQKELVDSLRSLQPQVQETAANVFELARVLGAVADRIDSVCGMQARSDVPAEAKANVVFFTETAKEFDGFTGDLVKFIGDMLDGGLLANDAARPVLKEMSPHAQQLRRRVGLLARAMDRLIARLNG
jgi:hypothetical protein